MADVRSWKEGESGEPKFPSDFVVAKKAVLQVTDIVTNRNKYYAIELHQAKMQFRVFTHYGRTDDLESNPKAGVRESRYCDDLSHAESVYSAIFKQKTSNRKGYKEVNLASSKIGSSKTIGQSSGTIDDKTLKKLEAKNAKAGKAPKPEKSSITPAIAEFVEYLYSEAVNALTTTVNVSITANGIETPLGVLTLGQIDKGQVILDQIAGVVKSTKTGKYSAAQLTEMVKLTGEFYTVVPHKIGRSRDHANASVISSASAVNQKQDTLQLMRDMLNVNGKTNVLVSNQTDKKYKALNCLIETMSKSDDEYKKLVKYVKKSDEYGGTSIVNIYRVRRPLEQNVFRNVGNIKQLFHGSNVRNWVGILSRGILLPKTVVQMGGDRTDGGWLGDGIYFGDAITTSMGYAEAGERGTSFIAIADVSLGKMKEYTDITYGIKSPPKGYDSCHGNPDKDDSEFDDHEFVVYDQRQQKLQYLIECE